MKLFVRAATLLLFSCGVIYAMQQKGLFDLSYLHQALLTGKSWLFLCLFVQLVLPFALVLRYFYLIRLFGVRSDLSHVSAATVVGTAVGQWAPGSLAVMEVLRVGLMVGADKHRSLTEVDHSHIKGLKSRLAAASLFDRLIGFFVILLMGAVVSFGLILSERTAHLPPAKLRLLWLLASLSLAGALSIALLPLVSRIRLVSRLLVSCYLLCRRRASESAGLRVRIFNTAARIFKQLRTLQLTVVAGSSRARNFVIPSFISVLSSLLSCLALYYASIAVGRGIDFYAILAVFPVMAVSMILPIGFGGVGGQQLVAVGLFDIFALNAASVSAASLLQNVVYFVANTLLGLFFAHLSARQLRAIFAKRKSGLDLLGPDVA